MVEVNQARIRLLTEMGLLITQDGKEERRVPLKVVSSLAGLAPFRPGLRGVKSYQTEDVVRAMAPVITPRRTCSRCRTGSGTPMSWLGCSGPSECCAASPTTASSTLAPTA